MKRCCWCRQVKPLSAFHRRGDGHQAACKECRSSRDRDRYVDDPAAHAEVRLKRKRELAAWAFELKRSKPCTDCGQSYHPAAMQWDHIGNDKELNIADMARNGYSQARVLAEIAKCELVCGNCHAVRTYERRGINGL